MSRTQAEIAAEHGISRQRVGQIKDASPRTSAQRKRGAQVALSAGTDPTAAAERIREKLGEDFSRELAHLLLENKP